MLLSIVIPFFNVEKYIGKCLSSIVDQDFPHELYEVICINDGSQDSSKDIVIDFISRYSNIKLIEHAHNKKLGVARNTGRTIAQGKYIWNIDSDDYLKPNVLETLTKLCETNELDVLVVNFDHLIDSTEKTNMKFPFIDSNVLTGVDFLNKYCLNNFHEISPIWTQVYKRDFLEKNSIYSPPINMGEDVPFTLKTLLLAEKIMSITKSCYVYRLNQDSLGGKIEIKPTPEKLYEKCFECAKYVLDVTRYIPENEPGIRKAYINVVKYIISMYPNYIENFDTQEWKAFKTLCRRHLWSDVKILRYLGRKRELIYLLSVIVPLISRYRKLQLLYKLKLFNN